MYNHPYYSSRNSQNLQKYSSRISSQNGLLELPERSEKYVVSCPKCQEYERILNKFQIASQRSNHRHDQLKKTVQLLEVQNSQIMTETDDIASNFQNIMLRLENQVVFRENVIQQQNQEIQNFEKLLGQQEKIHEQQILSFRSKPAVSSTTINRKNFTSSLKFRKESTQNQQNFKQLQSLVLKQVSQKAEIQKKAQNKMLQFEKQKVSLKQEISTLEAEIVNKQKLIKYLSDSNNEIRIQLIQLKSKIDVEDMTWVTEKKRSFLNESLQQNRELKKQNQQMKQMISEMQQNIQNLLNEASEMQQLLQKVTLQKEKLSKMVLKMPLSPRSKEIEYGPLTKNQQGDFTLKMVNRSNSKFQIPGLIKIKNKAKGHQIADRILQQLQFTTKQ